jgi:hypothetical protein
MPTAIPTNASISASVLSLGKAKSRLSKPYVVLFLLLDGNQVFDLIELPLFNSLNFHDVFGFLVRTTVNDGLLMLIFLPGGSFAAGTEGLAAFSAFILEIDCCPDMPG